MRILIMITGLLFLFSCKQRPQEDEAVKKYFDANKVDGCFGMYDNSHDKLSIYNIKNFKQQLSPKSTFKIINTLIGLETGVITNDSMIIKWDSITRPIAEWNQDLTMANAFKYSCVPYYQEVARRIGAPTMKEYINEIKYGNMDISGPVDSFWLNNKLKISPDEQLGLIKKIYFKQIKKFQPRSYDILKKVMIREKNTAYELAYKTGYGNDEQGNQLAWIVGWVEENAHPYFFVLNLKTADKNLNLVDIRIKMLKDILTEKGFFKGNK